MVPGVDAPLDNHRICDHLHSGDICCLGLKTGADLVLASTFHVFRLFAAYQFCMFCPAVGCLASLCVEHFTGMCPLVQHLEQYG